MKTSIYLVAAFVLGVWTGIIAMNCNMGYRKALADSEARNLNLSAQIVGLKTTSLPARPQVPAR